MESVYLRFNSYDFEADERFQGGVKGLKSSSSTEETKLLDLKLFFYNRYETSVQTEVECNGVHLLSDCTRVQM